MKKLRRAKKNDNEWWKPIEETFAEVSPRTLRVICPQCKEMGVIATRWIRGPALKPIYVLHIERKKVRKICEPNQGQSKRIRGRVRIFESDIKVFLQLRKPFVLFSGGKDSLATLVYLKYIAKEVNRNLTAIYVDTTAGLDENMKYVREVCKYLGIDLEVVRPRVDYFTLAKKWGIPSFGYRWCCRELKIKPIKRFLDSIKEPKVIFDGIRAAESAIRKQYIPIWYHPSFKCFSVSPIFYWSDHQVVSVMNSDGIPKTMLHQLGTSTECWCGAYKTEKDFRKLYDLNRGMFHKLAEIEEQTKRRYTFIYKKGQKIPLSDLERQILKEKYMKS